MSDGTRIDLAHQASFVLGPLTVRPSTREVVGPAGTEVLEPRVMQVLVALQEAGGAIVSRDDLTQRCWEGRVVGEDAINRVISRLRRTAEATGAFRIETVTKVGYRLVGDGVAGTDAAERPGARDEAPAVSPPPPVKRSLGRRQMIAGAAVATGAAAVGAGWWWTHRQPAGAPASIAGLMAQARLEIVQLDRASEAQAVGLYRRAVEIEPGYADAWGQLAFAYVMLASFSPPAERVDLHLRADAAIERAERLDPANPYARLAFVLKRPLIGNWLALDRVVHAGLARSPDDELMMLYQSGVYSWTGRCRESAAIPAAVKAKDPPGPGPQYSLVTQLWGAGQLDDADRAMDDAFRLFPLNPLIWFGRFWLLVYSGRADQALTMARDDGSRPAEIREELLHVIVATAQAMLTRAASDIDAALALNRLAAAKSYPACEDAISFASAVGRVDEAFALLDALFFDKPRAIGPAGPLARVGTVAVRDRKTLRLFTPPVAAMRADPRFGRFTRDVGLDDYWRHAGVKPDYQRG